MPCLLELIHMSAVGTGMFEFLFIVVALSLNLLLVTVERVESECIKQAESVTVWYLLLLTVPANGVSHASHL